MIVMAPKDENEMRRMLLTALKHHGPIALRYPRGPGIGVILEKDIRPVPIGKAQVLKEGQDVLLLAIGRSVCEALAAYSELSEMGISATVVNCRFVKPLDVELIGALVKRIPRIITVEENVRQGGFGSAVLEALNEAGISGFQLERIGIPDTFVEHGSQDLLRSKYAIDAAAIVESAKRLVNFSADQLARWPSSRAV
jgi:1-deoxy-D-xylulose-5-phosphate synthase